MFFNIGAVAFETNILPGPFDVDRAQFAVQVFAHPIINLEGKNIGRGANLKHQVIAAAAVHGAIRNQEKIVRFGWFAVDKFIGVDFKAAGG